MPSELVFGFETEWLNYCSGAEAGRVASCVLRALAQGMPHVPCVNGGIFLQNSFRCYVDCSHIETASCEVGSPLDIVAAMKGMERILLAVSAAASQLLGSNSPIQLGRANVDPCSGVTYGQHESFLTKHSAYFYVDHLVPFLVTRPIWSGAGGLAPGTSSMAFAVSPRLLLFSTVSTGDTTAARPIVNVHREEPLAKDGNYRLHIIAGETLASEYGLYLKAGVTALVVRVAELGTRINLDVAAPVDAMHAVALDPSCKEFIRLSNGQRFTAVQIQSEYLDLIEKHLADLPAWAPDVCRCWRRVLSALAEDPLLLSRTLDWPLKYTVFKAHAEKIDTLVDGRDLIGELRQAAAQTAYADSAPSLEFLLGPSSPVLGKAAMLNQILRAHGLKWSQLKSSEDGRARLAEILDVRFGILGDGLFDQLDRQGFLQHRVVEDAAIKRAMTEAPPGTRAHLRSHAIRELAGRTAAGCSWEQVLDKERGFLDLSDPREQSAQWRQPVTRDQIARRAYLLWRQRGSPFGSPDVDWERAVQQLLHQRERESELQEQYRQTVSE